MSTLSVLIQGILFLAAAPLLSGCIAKIKNNLRMRRGPGIFQPYYNLAKLFSKEEVVSATSSWVFRVSPYVVFASSMTAALLTRRGDFLVLIFVLALGRFFMALAALDTGSVFGGMGASREMFVSSLAEPAACLVIFTMALQYGSTGFSVLSGEHASSVASLVAVLSLFLVVMAETSRIPVDNQETHLELTMIHEAMVLEYSGRPLALLEMAFYVRQMIWFALMARIIMPAAGGLIGIGVCVVAVAVLEVSVAKMRLLRVADYMGFAFVLGVVAAVCAILGV